MPIYTFWCSQLMSHIKTTNSSKLIIIFSSSLVDIWNNLHCSPLNSQRLVWSNNMATRGHSITSQCFPCLIYQKATDKYIRSHLSTFLFLTNDWGCALHVETCTILMFTSTTQHFITFGSWGCWTQHRFQQSVSASWLSTVFLTHDNDR